MKKFVKNGGISRTYLGSENFDKNLIEPVKRIFQTSSKSFLNLEYWINRVKQNGDSDVEIILIGNKIDLINDINVD